MIRELERRGKLYDSSLLRLVREEAPLRLVFFFFFSFAAGEEGYAVAARWANEGSIMGSLEREAARARRRLVLSVTCGPVTGLTAHCV